MSSWIKAEHWFKEQSALLVVGERDARDIGCIVREHQDDPELMREYLSKIVDACRPDLVGHTIWFMRFSPEKRAWEMYVNHPSLPNKERYAESPSQWLRLEDALPPKTAKDIGEIVDATLRDYMKCEPNLKPLLPRKTTLADQPIIVR